MEVPSTLGVLTRGDSSLLTAVYNPKAFIPHAASLGQGFPHCRSLSTAASRRSLGRISVPVWPVILSDRLPIVALVGRYPANKLMGRGLLLERQAPKGPHLCPSRHATRRTHAVLATRWNGYSPLEGRLPTRYSPVRHSTGRTEARLSRSTCMPNPRRQRSF